MNERLPILHVLLMEDDRENLDLLLETLPAEIKGHRIVWDPCADFEAAVQKAEYQRYDLVLTDIYRDRTSGKKNIYEGDVKAGDVIAQLIDRRFCPVVVFSDGSKPANIDIGPFVRFADKSAGNQQIVECIADLISTGIPQTARVLHDELDRLAGSYLWQFLKANWDALQSSGMHRPEVLERILRRRAAIQLSRLDPTADEAEERAYVEGAEFYIYPSVAGNEIRLGEVVQHNVSGEFRVVLTPHCHLTIQPGDSHPRAEFIMTVKAIPAGDAIANANQGKNPWKGTEEQILDRVRRRINSPADQMGRPAGRYWFLPGFLDIPDLYCDFLQVESIAFTAFSNDYTRIAVLDTPFAEAVQSCFTKFYSAVGIPGLLPERFTHLSGPPEDT